LRIEKRERGHLFCSTWKRKSLAIESKAFFRSVKKKKGDLRDFANVDESTKNKNIVSTVVLRSVHLKRKNGQSGDCIAGLEVASEKVV
jgi:hypothetical protein